MSALSHFLPPPCSTNPSQEFLTQSPPSFSHSLAHALQSGPGLRPHCNTDPQMPGLTFPPSRPMGCLALWHLVPPSPPCSLFAHLQEPSSFHTLEYSFLSTLSGIYPWSLSLPMPLHDYHESYCFKKHLCSGSQAYISSSGLGLNCSHRCSCLPHTSS